MERQSEWGGMILHLYRQVDSSVHSSTSLKELVDGDIHTYKAFGNYDRLCFTPVYRFVDYMKRSENAYQWIGGHKDIMMYPVRSADAERHFLFTPVSEKQMNLVMDHKYERRFLIMTMFFISGEVKERLEDYQKLLKRCNVHIGEMIKTFNAHAGYNEKQAVFGELFGTFNSAELCILWGANQFTDVQYLVDQIRYLSIGETDENATPLFASSYTIVGMYKSISEILAEGFIKGGAMIQLASASLRSAASVDKDETPIEYLNSFQNDGELFEVEACSGEYDFILNTRPPRLDLFAKPTRNSSDKKYRNLHYKNIHYRKHFSSTTTRLYYNDRDIPDELRDVDWQQYRRINGVDILKDKPTETASSAPTKRDQLLFGKTDFNRYKKKMTRSINDVSSLGINLQLFYSDYLRALHMTPDRQWTKDLQYQVKTAFAALESFEVRRGNKRLLKMDREYIEWSEMILQTLRNQIHHITEAGKFTFEEPCLRANSTVEYDLLFHMFYGAAKEILNCIYDRNGGSASAKQSTLVPLIQFQPKPIIESALWFDKDNLDNRLLDIQIPYDAWGEPQFFIPYLVHEFYHFAAPVDRDVRNEYFSKFLLSEIFRTALQGYLFDAYEPYWKAIDPKKKPRILKKEEKDILIAEVTNQLSRKLIEKIASPDVIIRNMMQTDYSPDFPDSEQEKRLSVISRGDAGWNVYKEAFRFWCCCLSGESDGEQNCAGFFRKVLKESLVTLRAEGRSSDDNEILYDILEIAIGNDTHSNRFPLDAELVEHVRNQANYFIQRSRRGLREIFPDYAMVTLCDLGVKEYLLLFAVLQDKCFTTSGLFNKDDATTLRIGCILNHLLKKENPAFPDTASGRFTMFEAYREQFVGLYHSYCNCCGWSDSDKMQSEPDIIKTANIWFDGFKARLSDYYSCHAIYENLMEKVLDVCFAPLCPSGVGAKLRSVTRSYFSALSGNDIQKLFCTSLKAIWRLQPQQNLQEMQPRNPTKKSSEEEKKAHSFEGIPRFKTTDLGTSYMRTKTVILLKEAEEMQMMIHSITTWLQSNHQKAFGTLMGFGDLWYRGVWNSEFGILPSAIVHFLDMELRPANVGKWNKGVNSMGRLWDYQYRLLQRFKYQADGAGEMLNSASYTTPDYLALMQHYEQKTCYLDWSEDAFSSLFFALEHYVMQESLNDQEDEKAASLFILDPMLYNRARKKISSDKIDELHKSVTEEAGKKYIIKLMEQNNRLNSEPEGSIPDISLKWNLRKYPMFTMEEPAFFTEAAPEKDYLAFDRPMDGKKAIATLEDFPEEVLNLPLAVHTPRLNPRIRKQSGQFMVYSYLSRPAYQEDEKECPEKYVPSAKRFDYLALQRIQDYFLKKFTDEYPFMYELRIDCTAKAEIADFLRNAGIHRFGIYPELEKLKL